MVSVGLNRTALDEESCRINEGVGVFLCEDIFFVIFFLRHMRQIGFHNLSFIEVV